MNENQTRNSKAAQEALKVLSENCNTWTDHLIVSLTLLCIPFVGNDFDYEDTHNKILELIESGALEEAFKAIKVDE